MQSDSPLERERQTFTFLGRELAKMVHLATEELTGAPSELLQLMDAARGLRPPIEVLISLNEQWETVANDDDIATAFDSLSRIYGGWLVAFFEGINEYYGQSYADWPDITDAAEQSAVARAMPLAYGLFFTPLASLLEQYVRRWHPGWDADEIEARVLDIVASAGDALFGLILQRFLDGDDAEKRYHERVTRRSESSDEARKEEYREHRERSRWFLYPQIADIPAAGEALYPDAREAMIEHIVDNIAWRLRNEEAERELRARSKEQEVSREQAKRQVLRTAVALVLTRWEEAQPHRFGTEWVTDAEDKKIPILPSTLGWLQCWQWLSDEVPKAADAHLLDEPYPGGQHADLIALDYTEIADDVERSDPHILLANEEHQAAMQEQIRILGERLPPSERELLEALVEQAEPGRRGAVTLAAERLGIKPATARARLHAIRKRLREKT